MKLRFTKATLDNLATKKGWYSVTDTLVSGLELRVSPAGHKVFSLVYRQGSKVCRKKLGPYPTMKIRDARDLAKEYKARLLKDPFSVDPLSSVPSLAVGVDEYLEWLRAKPKKHKRADALRRLFDNNMPTDLAATPLSTVTRRDIRAVLDEIPKRAASRCKDWDGTASQVRVLSAYRGLYKFAVQQYDLEPSQDPTQYQQLDSKDPDKDRALDDDQIVAFWKGIDKSSMVVRLALRVLLLTGQRRAEVAGMRWDEIEETDGDWDAPIWTIPSERRKNGAEHIVPLAPEVMQLLSKARAELKSPTFVFPAPGNSTVERSIPVDSISVFVTRYRDRWGLPGVKTHDLRHSAATGMGELGHLEEVAQRVLGHKGRGVTARYFKPKLKDAVRAALWDWADHVSELVSS